MLKMLLDFLSETCGAIRDVVCKVLDYRTAKREAEQSADAIRKRDQADVEYEKGRAREAVANTDTEAITRAIDAGTDGAPQEIPGFQKQARDNAKRVKEEDTKAMTKTLKDLLLLAVAATLLAGGCATTPPAPAIPPALTWKVEKVQVNGETWYAVPPAVMSRILDKLTYLDMLEKQGRIKAE